MNKLNEKGMLYGVFITIPIRNFSTITSKSFCDKLYSKCCRAFIFVEYIPIIEASEYLAPTDNEKY